MKIFFQFLFSRLRRCTLFVFFQFWKFVVSGFFFSWNTSIITPERVYGPGGNRWKFQAIQRTMISHLGIKCQSFCSHFWSEKGWGFVHPSRMILSPYPLRPEAHLRADYLASALIYHYRNSLALETGLSFRRYRSSGITHPSQLNDLRNKSSLVKKGIVSMRLKNLSPPPPPSDFVSNPA